MNDDLAAVGERAALARIIPRLRAAEALLGPGDDAALVAAPDGRVLLSTDAVLNDLSDPIAAATTITAQCLSATGT